jgi:predicted  nucleic acid-binding Zn-ribbon protein
MGLVYFVVKRRLLLTDLPATTAPGPDLQSIIHAEFAALVPGLRSELIAFAEQRLLEIAARRMDEQISERVKQAAIFETAVKQSLEARFDTMLSRIDNNHNHYLTQVVGMASTVSGIKTTLDDAEKRRSQQIAAVNEHVVKQGEAVQELAGDVAQIKKDLYGVPDQDGQETLFSMIKGIRSQQAQMSDKLEALERESANSRQQLEEASAFISNRRNIESWIVSTGKWLWRNKVKGGAIIMALLTSGAAGAGVFSTIAQLVTKVLQP